MTPTLTPTVTPTRTPTWTAPSLDPVTRAVLRQRLTGSLGRPRLAADDLDARLDRLRVVVRQTRGSGVGPR